MKIDATEFVKTVGLDSLKTIIANWHGDGALELLEWQVQLLTGGSTAAGIYRVSGTAHDRGQIAEWSLVLKCIPAPTSEHGPILVTSDDPSSPGYWKREYLIYTSGLLDNLCPGFAAVRCLLAEEKADACWLWFEDLGILNDYQWPVAEFEMAARHLGSFNGMWMAQRKLPEFDWLNTSILPVRFTEAQLTEEALRRIAEEFRENPSLEKVWSDELIAGSWTLLVDRNRFLAAQQRLPKTFLHIDASRKNLHLCSRSSGSAPEQSPGEMTTVAIDWGFAGIGVVGCDLSFLIFGSARWFALEPAQIPEADARAFRSYLDGVYSSGWQGDARLVRLGYLLTTVTRFGPIWTILYGNQKEMWAKRLTAWFGRPVEDVLLRWSQVNHYVVDYASEARALMETLPDFATVRDATED